MTAHAKAGYAFYSVITPQVAREYELPTDGELEGDDLTRFEELKDLAERHGTTVAVNGYQLL